MHLHQDMIAPGLGVEPEKLRWCRINAGGTFGYKFSPTMEALVGAAGHGHRKAGVPVLRLRSAA